MQCVEEIPDASDDNPVTLWVNYNDIEHTYTSKTDPTEKGGTKTRERVISPGKASASDAKNRSLISNSRHLGFIFVHFN